MATVFAVVCPQQSHTTNFAATDIVVIVAPLNSDSGRQNQNGQDYADAGGGSLNGGGESDLQ